MILAVNTSSNALNQLAAGLAEIGLLSSYIRPYANLARPWERKLEHFPGIGQAYARTFGRRKMPWPLSIKHVQEAGIIQDFIMSAHARLPSSSFKYKSLRDSLIYARTNAIAEYAVRRLKDENVVVASWGCAEPVFFRMKERGGLCVLNYPLAHHRFTRRYLLEEAERQPAFRETLNGHDWPLWYEERLDAEIELADYILVGSKFAQESFIEEGVPIGKLIVIPYGADTDFFRPPQDVVRSNSSFRLLFVGQIGQRKGISYLLEAAQRLKKSKTSLTLVGQIQGAGEALEHYSDLFQHIPHLPRNDLGEVYKQADVFVFPTLVEGLGLVVLEAMASGLPVITTPNGPGDIVRDGIDGFIVPPRDVDAIVDSLERLRCDQALRKKMGTNARRRALEFTWESYRKMAVSQFQVWQG